MNTRLLLIDDNILFRKGLAALLSLQPDLSVVGDVGSGKEAAQVSMRLEPDILLIDIRLTGINGLDSAVQIKHRLPQVKAIILTNSRTEDHVRAALHAGIDGYILKDASLEELMIAIRCVATGKKYLSPDVSVQFVESFLHPEQVHSKSSQLNRLTKCERCILQLIAEGRTNRSAAEFLSVSPKTVEKHRARLKQKLGLHSATDLLLAAVEMGLIERPVSFLRLM
ncbi:MAG: response regulator transcription factor, partial [Rhodoferax sp.]|nr:response regulator transcription factor [Rhodoferax sp.]